jgi:hypothetical protein
MLARNERMTWNTWTLKLSHRAIEKLMDKPLLKIGEGSEYSDGTNQNTC